MEYIKSLFNIEKKVAVLTGGGRILDMNRKGIYPGYSLFGRMRSLAELRGLELRIIRSLELSN